MQNQDHNLRANVSCAAPAAADGNLGSAEPTEQQEFVRKPRASLFAEDHSSRLATASSLIGKYDKPDPNDPARRVHGTAGIWSGGGLPVAPFSPPVQGSREEREAALALAHLKKSVDAINLAKPTELGKAMAKCVAYFGTANRSKHMLLANTEDRFDAARHFNTIAEKLVQVVGNSRSLRTLFQNLETLIRATELALAYEKDATDQRCEVLLAMCQFLSAAHLRLKRELGI